MSTTPPPAALSATAITGIAAGVPYVAVPPMTGRRNAPVVVAWHLLDSPRTEAAFAAALPMADLDAWRVYLALPMCGGRAPEGGAEELMRRAMRDAVVEVHGPIATQAAAELEPVLAELRETLGMGDGPVALVGGSLGAAVVQLVLAEGSTPVAAAVLISPLVQLRPVVRMMSGLFGVDYSWSPESERLADRLDFVARAPEIARRGQPPLLLVVGGQDDADAFLGPARALSEALRASYDDSAAVALETVPGMGHALAEEPGVEPAPQTPAAREVDRLAVAWLARHLA